MIKAYDFDKTIYNGDSSVNFYIYCLKKYPSIIWLLPIQLWGILLYLLKIKNKKYMKEKFFLFLTKVNNVSLEVDLFWDREIKNIKKWYIDSKKRTDVVISASPEFLIKPLEKKLNIKVIATKVNKNTGVFEGENCFGDEKVKRFKEEMGNKKIKEFYSDSYSDIPMMKLANKAFLVDKDKIVQMRNFKKKRKVNLIFIVLLLFIIFIVIYCLFFYDKKQFPKKYVNSLNKYEENIRLLKRNVPFKYITKEKSDFYLFGMAYEDKFVYKDGVLKNITKDKIIFKSSIKKDLIVPNEYTVLMIDNNNKLIKIFENNKGLYIKSNSSIKTVFERENLIQLDEFNNFVYSELLKSLNQETLFNFIGSKPTPSIVYGNSWYRDAMLMTMVLEKTNNINIIKEWVDSISSDKVYDHARGKELSEADNLGEMLYIIYATKSTNEDLKNNIVEEIKRVKNKNNHIKSNIDAFDQEYYPTSIAKYALSLHNIDLGLKLPKKDDGYGKLTWYTSEKIKSNVNIGSGNLFPYLTWAQYQYDGSGNDLYLLSSFYPLSYEGEYNKKYKLYDHFINKRISTPHGWSSSELFLFLYNKGNNYNK